MVQRSSLTYDGLMLMSRVNVLMCEMYTTVLMCCLLFYERRWTQSLAQKLR